MMRPAEEHSRLSRKQLAILCYDDPMRKSELVADAEVDFSWVRSRGITAERLEAAGLGPIFLYQRGAGVIEDLVAIGYTSLHIAVIQRVCNEAILVFGAEAVRRTFVCTSVDAMHIAGTLAQTQMQLHNKDLLRLCKDDSSMALSVICQLPKQNALVGVQFQDILDCQLTAETLMQVGFESKTVRMQLNIQSPELFRLGFSNPSVFLW